MRVDAKIDAKTRKDGSIDMNRLAYQAKIQAHNIQAKHFLPKQDLHSFTGSLQAKGVGTDFLSPRTRLQAKAQVNQIQYGKYKLDHVLAVAHVANGKVHADIDSKNQYLMGQLYACLLQQTPKRNAGSVCFHQRRNSITGNSQ